MKKVFPGQSDNEEAVLVLRPHFLAVFKDLVTPFLIALASVLGMTYFYYNFNYFIVLFVVFLFSSFWFFYAYYIWSHDLYVVTDQRVIDIDQVSIFHSAQKEAYLDNVQDIVVHKKGVAATLFNFGTVAVQTSSNTQIDLADVPRPLEVKKEILDLAKHAAEGKSDAEEMSTDEMVKKLYHILKNNVPESGEEKKDDES